MKILSVTEFTTTEGTAKQTELELDSRAGIYFTIVTGTFKTPPFTVNQDEVPVVMLHGDREQKNVSLSVSGNTLTITQGYRQASHGFLIAQVNDDWADTSEMQTAVIDALEIESVTLNNNTTVSVNPSLNGVHVRLTSTGFTPNGNGYYSQEITTKDGKKYIAPYQWLSHQASSDPVRYDYIYSDLPRAVTAYIKP